MDDVIIRNMDFFNPCLRYGASNLIFFSNRWLHGCGTVTGVAVKEVD